jgi:hypothetical protein
VPSGRPGAVWSRRDGGTCGRAIITADAVWVQWDDLGVCRLRRPDTVDVWPRQDLDPDEAIRVFAHDLRPIVHQAFGCQALHGSAVLSPAGVLAFCGLSGAGKSTLAYALARRGWPQLADDSILLDGDASAGPAVRPLPFRRGLRAPSRAHFATLPAGFDADGNGEEVLLDGPRPGLAAVVLLAQDSALAQVLDLQALAPARAFTALLPHAHCVDPYDAAEAARLVRDYLALVSGVPIYQLTYRPSFASLDHLVDRVIALGNAPQIAAPGATALETFA